MLLCWSGVAAQGIQFQAGSFEEAQQKAAQEHKMLMLVVCADWMEVCEIMKDDIFAEKEIGDAYNGRFVSWSLDASQIEGHPFFAGVRILNIPEFIFFDHTGRPQYREKKFKDHDEMLAMAEAALDPQNHLDRLAEQYAAGRREPAFVRRYIVEMDAAGADMAVPSHEYLQKIARESLLETENWIIATIGVRDVADAVFQYVVGHLPAFKKQIGEEPVHEFVIAVYDRSLAEAARRQDAALLARCQSVVRQLLGEAAAKPVICNDEMTYHAAGANWDAYEKAAVGLIDAIGNDDAPRYNEVAWDIYLKCPKASTLQLAESWAAHSVAVLPEYWNYHTLGCLQLTNGNPAAAKKSAKNALSLTEPNSPEMAEVLELIEKIEKTR